MRRFAALALVLLPLAGCGLTGQSRTGAEAEPESPDHRACRQEAQGSPEIRRLAAQRVPLNDINRNRVDGEERVIFNRLYRDCLRSRGLRVPGGVEAERPR